MITPLALDTVLKQLNNPPDIKELIVSAHYFNDGFDDWWIELYVYSWSNIQPKLQRSEERRVL